MAHRQTPHLTLGPGGRLRHRIRPEEISNDLAGWLADDLVTPGLLEASSFESAFVSVVLSTDPDPTRAWTAFYRNTLASLATGGTPGGTNAGMAPVHDRAAALAVGSVVELGCCFGFLSLRLAMDGHDVTSVDLSSGTVRLLGRMASELGVPVAPVAGDATAVPLATGCADTVFAVHLLEHLPPGVDAIVLAEMLRLARRRVVVAVPYELEPDATWGHVRTFDAAALAVLGAATGRDHRVTDHHGGWLVADIDRSGTPSHRGGRRTGGRAGRMPR